MHNWHPILIENCCYMRPWHRHYRWNDSGNSCVVNCERMSREMQICCYGSGVNFNVHLYVSGHRYPSFQKSTLQNLFEKDSVLSWIPHVEVTVCRNWILSSTYIPLQDVRAEKSFSFQCLAQLRKWPCWSSLAPTFLDADRIKFANVLVLFILLWGATTLLALSAEFSCLPKNGNSDPTVRSFAASFELLSSSKDEEFFSSTPSALQPCA